MHRRRGDGGHKFGRWQQCVSKLPSPFTPGISEPHGPASLSSSFKSSGQATVWGNRAACGLNQWAWPRVAGLMGEGLGRAPSPGGGFWRLAVPLHGNSHEVHVHPLAWSSCVLIGGRMKGKLPLLLLHFPRAPISSSAHTALLKLCLCLRLAVPGSTFLSPRDCSRQLSWQLESLMPLSCPLSC